MGDVVQFGPKNAEGIVEPTKAPLVNAAGAEVKTPRSVQNDILQRRNFVLIDCTTGEVVPQTQNLNQAYAAVQHGLTQIMFNMIHHMASNAAVGVFKQIAEAEVKPESSDSSEPV